MWLCVGVGVGGGRMRTKEEEAAVRRPGATDANLEETRLPEERSGDADRPWECRASVFFFYDLF